MNLMLNLFGFSRRNRSVPRSQRPRWAQRGALAASAAGFCFLLTGGGRLMGAPAAASAATAKKAPTLSLPAAMAPVTNESIALQFDSQVKPFLAQHCNSCHANGKHKGDFTLDRYTSVKEIQADRRTWTTISDVLSQHAMPPEEKPQPAASDVNAVTVWIRDAMTHCDCTGPRDPGRVAIRRLNRSEYNNTIRDLVGIEDFEPAKDFPADDTGYGFDNIADVLTMSPLLAEKYLASAEQVFDKAMMLDNPFASRTRDFETKVMKATGTGNSGGDLSTNGEVYTRINFVTEGPYEFVISASQDKFGSEPARMTLKVDDTVVTTFDVANTRNRPKEYRIRTKVAGGQHRIAAGFINDEYNGDSPDKSKRGDRNLYVDDIKIIGPIDVGPPPPPQTHKRIFYKMPDRPSNEEACARELIASFATRAFRRPAPADEVDGLMGLYRLARQQGERFEVGVKIALEGVLVSPHFLYRIEVDPPTDPKAPRNSAPAHLISEYELATRMSYFLWGSMPDQELFDLAAAGKLRQPGVMDQQVKRMLKDGKAQSLVTNFAGQWLELRLLADATPDATLFPKFDGALRFAMKRETEMFLESIIREDRSVIDLIDSDYTFLNERLARHYGIDGVRGKEFRKVIFKRTGSSDAADGVPVVLAPIAAAC